LQIKAARKKPMGKSVNAYAFFNELSLVAFSIIASLPSGQTTWEIKSATFGEKVWATLNSGVGVGLA
jgi:hypothetical protein